MRAKKERHFLTMVEIINLNDQYLAVHLGKFMAYVDLCLPEGRRSDVAQSPRAGVIVRLGAVLAGAP